MLPIAQVPTFHIALLALSVVALLVSVSVLMRKGEDNEAEAPPRPTRRSPVNLQELARAVYEALQSDDFDGYRQLFLAGGEAADVFGGGADFYLQSRSPEILAQSMAHLRAQVPRGCTFGGVDDRESANVWMRVLPPHGAPLLIDVGTVARVGGIVRLRDPALPGAPAT